MGKPKVTAKKIMYIAAVQIVLTTVGFILYKRPYLWAWASLEYYKEIVCGDQLDSINAKFLTYSTEYQAQVVDKINKFRRNCNEAYLESFTEKFHDWCLDNYKAAFVSIPLTSTFLILGIVGVLHSKPFNKKTLKKPGMVFAFFFSLVLVSINVGQIVSIIVPMINPNASPDRDLENDRRAKCGYATEIMSLSLIAASSVLSSLIAVYVIRLYAYRAKYQDDHINELQMGGGKSNQGPPMAGGKFTQGGNGKGGKDKQQKKQKPENSQWEKSKNNRKDDYQSFNQGGGFGSNWATNDNDDNGWG